MKKYIMLTVLFCLFGLVACYDDDSVLGTKKVGKITIGELGDASIISYSGDKLEREPKIETDYSNDQLTYAWYLYKDGQKGDYQANKIDSVKNLSYEISLPSGNYVVVLEVTARENSYAAVAEMKLTVSTPFSQGFYVLKETAEGTTELDVYTQEGLMKDLLTQSQGKPMKGAPRNLSVCYDQAFIDTKDNEMALGNTVCITTETNEIACFRTEDMLKVFDKSNLFFEETGQDEIPYCMLRGVWMTFYFSNTGVRANMGGDISLSSGKLGFPLDNGSSKYVQLVGGMDMVYWNSNRHRLMLIDYNCVNVTEIENKTTVNQDNLECLTSGLNTIGATFAKVETIYFLCQDKTTGIRYLYLLSGGAITEIRPLNSGLHLAQGEIIAGCGLSGTLIYCVHNNKLYGYNFETGTETEIPVSELSTGNTISYISNQYWNMSPFIDTSLNFDYVVVGMQKGNDYTVYMYNIQGGQPYGEPVAVFSGKGKLRSVRYVSQVTGIFEAMRVIPFTGSCFPY